MKILPALLMLLPCLLRAEPTVPPHYLLIAASSTDTVLVERVRVWMDRYLSLPVEVSFADWEGASAAEQIEALSARVDSNVVAAVVLSDRLDVDSHVVLLPSARCGVVNLPVLKHEDPEINARRLERQALRIAAFTVGVSPAPIPFCCTASYSDLAELDAMGRGFSPPTRFQYEAALKARGIELRVPTPDAPPVPPMP